ncbi:3D domain-containing protein [Christiangramia crocea]|uniref:3D domain-containing protein n=1 Tax=Christiangramia crocea TaxID=2904124 RepID=A0A9X2A6V7_9FLAO|nr:3D domain-containing protein [Gramella crocea]MCG9972420.1 3D domain-containing protein [Gramella crocea]
MRVCLKLRNHRNSYFFKLPTVLLFLSIFPACKRINRSEPEVDWDTICVTATAYNSTHYQTEGDPSITAWGDTLKPGMRAIAVSRDLLRMGLDHNSQVKIEGFDSIYLVKDKMHYRWRNKIDIYMGEDVKKARKFGRKKINMAYIFKKDTTQN